MEFIVLGILVFIFFVLIKKHHATRSIDEVPRVAETKNHHHEDYPPGINRSSKTKIVIGKTDESIVDVTGLTHKLSQEAGTSKREVVYWPHKYIYSYSDIDDASSLQKGFYNYFKQCFLQGKYLYLNGNLNYAFILLFDVLNEYEIHKDVRVLENQVKALATNYPKTRSYGVNFLTERMKAAGDREGLLRLVDEERVQYNNNFDYDYWKLGSTYKGKLNLSKEQQLLLNKVWYSSNTFCSIEFCILSVITLYLDIFSTLNRIYEQQGTTVEKQFLELADIVARKQFKYRVGSDNYKYSIESITNELYTTVFKQGENAVREYYGHKRKINADLSYTSAEVKAEIEKRINSLLVETIPTLIHSLPNPDESTEVALNGLNSTRWKVAYAKMIESFRGDTSLFVEQILQLGKLNRKNPSVENIFYEASKFMSKHDKEAALTLYIHYLHHDLKSATFDNKQLTKTIQKSLFKSDEQLKDFEKIVLEFIKTKDLNACLEAVKGLYKTKRRRIQLDKTSIVEVQEKHSGTVGLLNEYLSDDEAIEAESLKERDAGTTVSFQISTAVAEEANVYVGALNLNQTQKEVLALFAKNNFTLIQSDLDVFAKANGLFKNQLIESINDKCYELLDDLLIEEEDEVLTINEDYYHKLIIQ